MTLRITLPLNALRAVALASADKDIRYYLNGVLLELTPSGTFLVATDGHRLHALRLSYEPWCAPARVVIPAAAIKSVVRGVKGNSMIEVSISDDLKSGQFEVGEFCEKWTAIDGRFPDWRRALPSDPKANGPLLSLAARYLTDAEKAASLLTDTKRPSVQTQTSPSHLCAVVLAFRAPEFVAVISPQSFACKDEPVIYPLPSFAGNGRSSDVPAFVGEGRSSDVPAFAGAGISHHPV